jgi:hypothetical protein
VCYRTQHILTITLLLLDEVVVDGLEAARPVPEDLRLQLDGWTPGGGRHREQGNRPGCRLRRRPRRHAYQTKAKRRSRGRTCKGYAPYKSAASDKPPLTDRQISVCCSTFIVCLLSVRCKTPLAFLTRPESLLVRATRKKEDLFRVTQFY